MRLVRDLILMLPIDPIADGRVGDADSVHMSRSVASQRHVCSGLHASKKCNAERSETNRPIENHDAPV